jgi:cobalt-zinc-cadmium efflux system protein
MALLADAGHNLGDVLGLALAWGAAWLSRRRPTPRRTYGWRRSSILAALANAALLLVAVGAIGVESVRRLAEPAPVAAGTVLAVASLGIAVNLGTALLFRRGRERDLNLRGAFLHMLADAAVTAGVILAALLVGWTGWLWLDPLTGLAIALVILAGTWGLLRDAVNLALDAVPENVDRDAVEAFLAAQPGVVGVHDLHIWPMSTTEVALTAHLVRPDGRTDDGLLGALQHQLQARFGIDHATIQLESGALACPCPLVGAAVP